MNAHRRPAGADHSAARPATPHHLQQPPMRPGYRMRAKPAGPARCPGCGAAFQDGRWRWPDASTPEAAEQAFCPACLRIREQMPAGYVDIAGAYVAAHREELLARVRHVSERARLEHPLQRLMEIAEHPDGSLGITVTDTHLARAIGEALQQACHGTLSLNYAADEDLLRVRWERA